MEIIERAIDLDTWKQMMQVLKIRKNLTTSDKLIKKDGTTLTVESNVHIVEIEGTYYIITSTRDLTEEENVIDLIESNEQRYKFLFDNARVGILLINLNGSIAAVNKELLNILKIKSIKDLSKSRENEIHMGLINQCIAKKQTISTTIKLTNRKPAMNLSICYSPIFNSKNEMTGIQGIIHEIK